MMKIATLKKISMPFQVGIGWPIIFQKLDDINDLPFSKETKNAGTVQPLTNPAPSYGPTGTTIPLNSKEIKLFSKIITGYYI